jgi:hypothetical protein
MLGDLDMSKLQFSRTLSSENYDKKQGIFPDAACVSGLRKAMRYEAVVAELAPKILV